MRSDDAAYTYMRGTGQDKDGEVDGVRKCDPWEHVLADASPHDHIVQLYQDHDFLKSAVCLFIGAGLRNGDRIILFPTLSHWNAFRGCAT